MCYTCYNKQDDAVDATSGQAIGEQVGDIDASRNNSVAKGQNATRSNDEEKVMSQCLMATYKVNQSGGMRRVNEVDVQMGRKFFSSQDGNMSLTRSYDKKLISLANFEE